MKEKYKSENKARVSSLKYRNKLDNFNLEQSLENKRKKYEERIKEIKLEIKRLFEIIANLKKEIEDMNCSKDILENYSKYKQEEKFMKKMSLVGRRMDRLTEIEFEKVSYFKKMMDVNLFYLKFFIPLQLKKYLRNIL